MKDIQKIKEFFSKPLKETIKTPSDAIDFLNKNKDKLNKIANQYKGDVASMQIAIDDFLAPYIENTPEFIVTRLKVAIGKAISKMNIKADPDLSATYDKLKNAKTFVGESNKPQFKKGDKVTYLGHPGEITAVNKEMTGEITYSVAYDKGQGRTKASNINLKSGAIKPLEEALNPEVISKVNRFIKALANHYDYSEQDAVYAIMQALRTTNFQGINEAMTTAYESKSISDYKVGDILKFKDGEDWKVMKVKDNVGKLVIKPHNDKAKEGNVSLEIDIDANYLKKNLLEAKEIELNDKQKKYLKSILNNRYGKGTELGYIDNGVEEFIQRVNLDLSKEELQDLLDKDILKIKTKPGKKPYKALFLSKDLNKMNLNEAKEEDAVDTITMDIPLFLRMLEYAREDAEQDLDLHDVTEKANKLGKERGILSMDDYEEIVGAAEDAPKEELSEVNLKKGDTIKFTNGETISIIGPKGDGYDYVTSNNQRSWQLKKWFDMMLSSGKATMNEGMGGQLDEPFFIRVSVNDAQAAMDIFNSDEHGYKNSNIKKYGSGVYAANTPEDIFDLYYDFISHDIEVLEKNVDEEDYDYDSEYEKTLVEKILSKIKEKY